MLSKDQVAYLFTFCELHYVHYYDVQVELVDHLANAVEQEMKNDPKVSFEKALEKVYRGFGYMGFAPLVSEKQKSAAKQSRKMFWKLFKKQFSWPEIILFFVLSTGMYTIFSLNVQLIKWFYVMTMLGAFAIMIGIWALQILIMKRGKKFLVINFSGLITSLIIWPPNLLNILRGFSDKSLFEVTSPDFLIPASSIFLSIYIIILITIWQTVSSIKNELSKNYPEVFAVAD